jgi:hypothetical protein
VPLRHRSLTQNNRSFQSVSVFYACSLFHVSGQVPDVRTRSGFDQKRYTLSIAEHLIHHRAFVLSLKSSDLISISLTYCNGSFGEILGKSIIRSQEEEPSYTVGVADRRGECGVE